MCIAIKYCDFCVTNSSICAPFGTNMRSIILYNTRVFSAAILFEAYKTR